MAYYSKYTGAKLEEKLDKVEEIPQLIAQMITGKNFVTKEDLLCVLKDYAPADYRTIPIDKNTIYWENGVLKAATSEGGQCQWELREHNGIQYLYSRLPVVTQYDVTMYADVNHLDLPSIYDGLPIDGDTIYWEETEDGKVLKAKSVGGSGESIDAGWVISVISNAGFATQNWVNNQNFITQSYLATELLKYVTLDNYQEIIGVKNFINGLQISNIPIKKLEGYDDILYIDSNVVIRGGLTMYYEDGDIDLPSIKEEIGNAGYDGTTGLASFNSEHFSISSDGIVSIIGGTGGLDIEQLESYLTSNKYVQQSYVDNAVSNIATILSTKWTTDNNLINQWNTAYGWGDHSKVGYALKSYVDDTFVTIKGNEDVTGLHNFVNGLKIGGMRLSKSQEGVVYLEGNLVVKGGVTMYALDEVTVDSIIDSLPPASTSQYGIAKFNPSNFVINEDGFVTIIGGSSGLDTEELAEYLAINKYATQGWVEGKGYITSSALNGYATQSWVTNQKYITGITSAMVVSALGFTPYNSANFTKANIKSTLGISDWALASTKPSYTFSEIGTKPTTIAGYGITDAYTKQQLDNTFALYIPIAGYTNVTGEKNFTGGLRVNNSPSIYYDATNKYWKLEGDLLVTGGVTMYGSDDSDFGSIFDEIPIDGDTIYWSNGVLKAKGGGSVSGDYLPLSGGTIDGAIKIYNNGDALTISTTDTTNTPALAFERNKSWVGTLGVNSDRWLAYYSAARNKWEVVLNSYNYSSYALPLSGGTITSSITQIPLIINSTGTGGVSLALNINNSTVSQVGYMNNGSYISCYDGRIGVRMDGLPIYKESWGGAEHALLHAGNYSSYALPKNNTSVVWVTNSNTGVVNFKSTAEETGLRLYNGDTNRGGLWYGEDYGIAVFSNSSQKYLGIKNDGTPHYWDKTNSYTLLYAGNYSNYALPLSGGTLTGPITFPASQYNLNGVFGINLNNSDIVGANSIYFQDPANTNSEGLQFVRSDGNYDVVRAYDGVLMFATNQSLGGGGASYNTVWHSGNLTSLKNPYALSWSGYSSGSYDGSSAKSITIPSNTNQLTNGAGFITSSASITGNAGSATKLQTARTIWGQSFDGTGNVSGEATIEKIHLKNTYINLNRNGSDSSIYDSTKTALEIEATKDLSILRTYNVTTQASIVLHKNGNVGIGITNPEYKLHIVGQSLLSQSANGDLYYRIRGVNYELGFGLGSGGVNRGIYDWTNASWLIYRDSSTNVLIPQGYVGIGTKSPSQKLHVSGNILTTGGITMYSDIRKKTKLQDVELSLSQIANAPLIEHYYNSDQNKTTHVGSIAQYWAGLNDWFCKLDNEGYYTMEIQNCALASAISIARHLEKYESKTDKKIRMLKKRVKELEDKLEKLEGGKYGCN